MTINRPLYHLKHKANFKIYDTYGCDWEVKYAFMCFPIYNESLTLFKNIRPGWRCKLCHGWGHYINDVFVKYSIILWAQYIVHALQPLWPQIHWYTWNLRRLVAVHQGGLRFHIFVYNLSIMIKTCKHMNSCCCAKSNEKTWHFLKIWHPIHLLLTCQLSWKFKGPRKKCWNEKSSFWHTLEPYHLS